MVLGRMLKTKFDVIEKKIVEEKIKIDEQVDLLSRLARGEPS